MCILTSMNKNWKKCLYQCCLWEKDFHLFEVKRYAIYKLLSATFCCFPPNRPRDSAIEMSVLSSRLMNSFRLISVKWHPKPRFCTDILSGNLHTSNLSSRGTCKLKISRSSFLAVTNHITHQYLSVNCSITTIFIRRIISLCAALASSIAILAHLWIFILFFSHRNQIL